MKLRITTIVTDLDNTLYDWFEFWHASFGAMLRVLVAESGVPEEEMKREIRAIHQKHGTSEYSTLIQDLPCLQKKFPGEDLSRRFSAAISAYKEARSATLRLYPTVMETLSELKRRGVLLIGYTDSRAYPSAYRVRTLGLDGILDYLYSPPDHQLPAGTTPEDLRTRPAGEYKFKFTSHRHTPEGERKPNPHILRAILGEVGAVPEHTAYVGDSLMNDIVMAQQAGVPDVHAAYGAALGRKGYDLLQAVSHWKQAAVDKEKGLTAAEVRPKYLLKQSLGEILGLFAFESFGL